MEFTENVSSSARLKLYSPLLPYSQDEYSGIESLTERRLVELFSPCSKGVLARSSLSLPVKLCYQQPLTGAPRSSRCISVTDGRVRGLPRKAKTIDSYSSNWHAIIF